MRWSLSNTKRKFAIIPHQCIACRIVVWLETYIKEKDSYGDVFSYCEECGVRYSPYCERSKHD